MGWGWGGSRAEGRGTGGCRLLGPLPLPSAVQEQRELGRILIRLDPWSLPGKLPQGCQAPRAEMCSSQADLRLCCLWPAWQGDAQGSMGWCLAEAATLVPGAPRSPDLAFFVENLMVAGGAGRGPDSRSVSWRTDLAGDAALGDREKTSSSPRCFCPSAESPRIDWT